MIALRRWPFLALTLCAMALCKAAAAEPSAYRTDRIIVVHSYHVGFSTTEVVIDSMSRRWAQIGEVQHYFLDTKRFDVEASFASLRSVLAARVAERGPPDLVVALDDNALDFVDQYSSELFRGAPIVFAGVNSRDRAAAAAAKDHITGVFEGVSIADTIDLAQAVHPERLTTLSVIADDSTTSRAVLKEVRSVLASRADAPALELLELGRMSFAAAAEAMAADRRAGLAYIFAAAFRDQSGRMLNASQVFATLTPRSARPVYTLTHPTVLNGVAGGRMVTPKSQIEAAMSLGERILAGETPASVAPVMESPNVSQIDLGAARRFGLRLDRLGPEVQLIRAEPDFWTRNRGAVAVVVGVIIVLGGAFLITLYISRSVRNGLEALNAQLLKRNRALEHAQQRIAHQSSHDALTGLKNRNYLEQRLREFGTRDAPSSLLGAQWALLHIDLDHFRELNDVFGLEGGDEALRLTAKRIELRTPPGGFCGRLNGDGFALCAPFRTSNEASEFAEDLLAALREPVTICGETRRLGASIGVAIAKMPREISQMSSRLREADAALHHAKSAGRGCVVIFSARHQREANAKREMSDEFLKALTDCDFVPYFQPQFCAKTGRIVGVEALARWRHATRGVLNPSEFIGVAAGLDKLGELDRMILERTVDELRHWRAKGVYIDQVSVNFSARRLADPALLESIDRFDLGGAALCVELLESIFLDQTDESMERAIAALRKRGVRIEIDDFGTGHASVLAVMRRRPDGFKIARELIAPMSASKEQEMLVGSLIEIGKTLGVSVVAEGVETSAQRRKLAALGCDVLQGFALGRPMPGDRAASFIAANHRSHPAELAG